MLQIKKLQEVNKFLKVDNARLLQDNTQLVDQHSNLKILMINYEKESLYHRIESQYMFEELAKENDNLKRLLLINHEFTEQIGARILEIEKEEQEKQLKKFRDL